MPRLFRHIFLLTLLAVFLAIPQRSIALSKSDYYDWGPYYQNQIPQSVLGITFSNLEEFPAPSLPPEAVPPPATGIMPGHPLYGFETFSENLQLNFTFNPTQKAQLYLDLAEERFQEAATLIAQGESQLAQVAADRYQDTLQTLSTNLPASLAPAVQETMANHTLAAQTLALSSAPAIADTWNNLLLGSEVAMDAAADAQDEPPLPPDLATTLNTLEDQGLITPEQVDKLTSLDSRAAVRDEIDSLVTSGQFPLSATASLDTALAAAYPDQHQNLVNIYEYAELQSYQSLPQPSDDIKAKLSEWQDNPDDLPPPADIRPYLYIQRAEELIKTIDLTLFSPEQQAAIGATPRSEAETPRSPATGEGEVGPTTAGYVTTPSGPLPGDPTYFFKSFGEGLRLFTTFNPENRAELELQFAEERLREANTLSQNPDRADDYTSTLRRYQSTLNSVNSNLPPQIAEEVEHQLSRHNAIFEKGLLPPPPDNPEVYNQAIVATENVLDSAADGLNRPPLPPALNQRLQDLKAQGLITDQEVANLTQANSRADVRNQIRELTKAGSFPPADAKKLDEAQSLVSPQDYQQLIEVRKIEELNRLRAVQAEFAQIDTARANVAGLQQRLDYLKATVDPAFINPDSLTGPDRDAMLSLYNELKDIPRPINGGQIPLPAEASAEEGPARSDAVLTTCPGGSLFKQL